MAKKHSFDRYRKEARSEPFELELSDGTEISIPAPTGETLFQIEESRSSRYTLELLTGDHYEQIMDEMRTLPASAMNALAADMIDHFGLVQPPPGGGRALPR